MPVINIYKTEEVCANCKHFYLHYVVRRPRGYDDGTLMALSYGHCVEPRIKKRAATDTCKRFSPTQERAAR